MRLIYEERGEAGAGATGPSSALGRGKAGSGRGGGQEGEGQRGGGRAAAGPAVSGQAVPCWPTGLSSGPGTARSLGPGQPGPACLQAVPCSCRAKKMGFVPCRHASSCMAKYTCRYARTVSRELHLSDFLTHSTAHIFYPFFTFIPGHVS